MAKKITSAMIPSLHLSESDECELRLLGATLQREGLLAYEQFLAQQRRQVDVSQWKLVRSVDDIHAFVEREPPAPSAANGPHAALAAQLGLPRVHVTGTVSGSLDDVMFGSSFYDTPSLRERCAYQDDFMEDSAVLATIDGTSSEDPYRFVGIVWVLRTYGLPTPLLSKRDSLLLFDVHTLKLSNGERVGVIAGHSIQHQDLPELTELSTVRTTSSLITIYRQLDAGRVEVFAFHVGDSRGNTCEKFSTQESVKLMMPGLKSTCDGGFRRKLHWLLRRRQQEQLRSRLGSIIEPKASGDSSQNKCELCGKSLSRLFACSKPSCSLCSKHVCSRCRVTHEIVVDTTKFKPVVKAFDFCLQCVLQARAESTLAIARRENAERVLFRAECSATLRERTVTTVSRSPTELSSASTSSSFISTTAPDGRSRSSS